MIECCANSIESAKNGEKGGAQRIELCKKLEVGGITPSRQEILQAKKLLNIKLHVLIRPRKGDFIYTNNEMQQIIEDIKFCKKVNCDGVVIGALKKDGSIDTSKIIEMIKYAKPMHTTFHRAFDNGNNLLKNLEDVISCGCDTLLTSGQAKDVDAGMQNICTLIKNAQKRINILAGGGVDINNIETLYMNGVRQFHLSGIKNKKHTQITDQSIISNIVKKINEIV